MGGREGGLSSHPQLAVLVHGHITGLQILGGERMGEGGGGWRSTLLCVNTTVWSAYFMIMTREEHKNLRWFATLSPWKCLRHFSLSSVFLNIISIHSVNIDVFLKNFNILNS